VMTKCAASVSSWWSDDHQLPRLVGGERAMLIASRSGSPSVPARPQGVGPLLRGTAMQAQPFLRRKQQPVTHPFTA